MLVDAKLVDAFPKYLKTMLIKPTRKTIWLNHFKKTTFLKNSKYLRAPFIIKFYQINMVLTKQKGLFSPFYIYIKIIKLSCRRCVN